MTITKRLLGIIVSSFLICGVMSNDVYAAENKMNNYQDFTSSTIAEKQYTDVIDSEYFYEGPSVVFDLNEDNNYTDSITLKSESGVTVVTCSLSGHTGGIANLYEIIIHWKGNNRVKYLKADKLYIDSGSVLHPKTYWNNSFNFDCRSTMVGANVVGSFQLPPNLKRVHVSTKMLQAYFNDRDYWLRINEINGYINL